MKSNVQNGGIGISGNETPIKKKQPVEMQAIRNATDVLKQIEETQKAKLKEEALKLKIEEAKDIAPIIKPIKHFTDRVHVYITELGMIFPYKNNDISFCLVKSNKSKYFVDCIFAYFEKGLIKNYYYVDQMHHNYDHKFINLNKQKIEELKCIPVKKSKLTKELCKQLKTGAKSILKLMQYNANKNQKWKPHIKAFTAFINYLSLVIEQVKIEGYKIDWIY
jgi:hypothetical protein